MGRMPLIDDMSDADKAYILAHSQDILEFAAEIGITNVLLGHSGRPVRTITDDDVSLANYAFTARAGSRLEYTIHRYPDEVAANPGAGQDVSTDVRGSVQSRYGIRSDMLAT